MERLDLQMLRDLPIEEVAERLGLQVTHHKALCPFHDDHHASLSFRASKNTYRCFVCGAHGGTIDLVMKILNKDFREACAWLSSNSKLYTLNSTLSNHSKLYTLHSKLSFDATKYERFFEQPLLNDEARHFLFSERKLDLRVVQWCRLTSWRDRNGTPWLQIPYYNTEGKLVGIQNRNLIKGVQPRFKFPRGSQCGIYNLPVLNMLKPGEALYIAEGCSDCWSLLSAGHKAIAIPSATLLSKKDVEKLSTVNSQLSTEFHMYPDKDAPGERLFLQLQKVLPNLVHHQLPANCKDYSDYYLSTFNYQLSTTLNSTL